MSFPWHHRPWRETAEFVEPRVHDGDRVLAPDQFWSVVTRVDRYVPANLDPGTTYDWVVLNMDDMGQVPRPFLEGVAARMTPVFVNDQFVVWHAADTHEPEGDLRNGLARFWARLAKLGPEPSEPNRCVQDMALADAPRITRLRDVDDIELRAAMNDLFRRTGYLYPTERDRTYRADMQGHVRDLVARHAGGRVLDLATGGERFLDLPDGTLLVRSDLAVVGVERARQADGNRPGLAYAVTDAGGVAFPDASFDAVLFTDSIEHVRDAGVVLQEAARVLRAGGELLVTYANLDSVNQVLAEKLGYPRFPTNHQHIREFTLAEVSGLVDDAGLEIVETAGVSLYPYWAVPGVDDVVRTITDDDPEFVAMMAELGRRVGAEYAYTGVVLAQRPLE